MNQDRLLENWIAPVLDPDSKVPKTTLLDKSTGTKTGFFDQICYGLAEIWSRNLVALLWIVPRL